MKRQNITTEKGSNISYKNSAAGKLRVKSSAASLNGDFENISLSFIPPFV